MCCILNQKLRKLQSLGTKAYSVLCTVAHPSVPGDARERWEDMCVPLRKQLILLANHIRRQSAAI